MAKSKFSFIATLGCTVLFLAALMAGAVKFHAVAENLIRAQQVTETQGELQKLRAEFQLSREEAQKQIVGMKGQLLAQYQAEKAALEEEIKAAPPKAPKAMQLKLTQRREQASHRLEYLAKELPALEAEVANAAQTAPATAEPVKAREPSGTIAPRAAWMEQVEKILGMALLPAIAVLFGLGLFMRLLSLVAARPFRFFRAGAGSAVLDGIPGLLLAGGIGAVMACLLLNAPTLSQLSQMGAANGMSVLKTFLGDFSIAMRTGLAGVCGFGILYFFNSLAQAPVTAKAPAKESTPRPKKGPLKAEESLRHQKVTVIESPKKANAETEPARKPSADLAPPSKKAAAELPAAPPSSKKAKAVVAPPPPAEIPIPTPLPSVEDFPDFEAPPSPSPADDFRGFGESSIDLPELPTNTAEVNLNEAFPVLTEIPARTEAPLEVAAEEAPHVEDRLANLRHRLETLNEYIQKADEDKASGVMPIEMWEEERAVYLEEKQRLEVELTELEHARAA